MGDKGPQRTRPPSSLTEALRAARLDEAERSQALGDLRGAELARLDLLREALDPVLAQIPAEIDLFDTGVVPGERPRLFIDMIAFVEMGRDRRTYRFLQDSRHGRTLLAENESVGTMLDVVTRYIARRLVEREKILAALGSDLPELPDTTTRTPSGAVDRAPPPTAGPRPLARGLARAARLAVDGLGLLALATVFWLGVQYFGGHAPAW